jgi:flagellar biosynthesis protein FlhA
MLRQGKGGWQPRVMQAMAEAAVGTDNAVDPVKLLIGLGVPLVLVAFLAMITIPLQTFLLDFLFTFNIALSMIILLTSIYNNRPLDFSIFPTVILIATLLRLALNIASTRVVLLNGHSGTDAAGKVIESFGDFVVGGNYTVGLVVFIILVVINFVVVTKGAGRVSEVTARFTLDAMPGKQMAIDADLAAGILTHEEAKLRRQEIGRESDFYGAMDGASKFVRGDAIASILIVIINIVGGLVVGTAQHDLSFGEAARNYVLLTIGDGLVAQIPSLLLSTATAIIVTRVSASHDLGSLVRTQLFSYWRSLAISAGVIGAIGLLPGMPNLVFILLASVLGVGAWLVSRAQQRARAEEAEAAPEPKALPDDSVKELTLKDVAPVEPVSLDVGYRLIPLVDQSQGGQLMSRIKGVRRKLSTELGFLIPQVHIRDDLELGPNSYRISVNGVALGEADIQPDREMAISSGQVYGHLDGIRTKDPSFGLDAIWISPAQRDEAQTLGYTVVDASTVVATHLSQLLEKHAHELLGHEDVQQLLDRLAQRSPKLVEELVPKTLSLATVVRVLQELLQERVPIRDLRTIVSTLLDAGQRQTDTPALVAAVRQALSRYIVQGIVAHGRELPLITLNPGLEQLMQQSGPGQSGGVGLEPGLAERLQSALKNTAQRLEAEARPCVLVVTPELRPWVSKWLRSVVPELYVLSYNEIPDNIQLRIVVTLGDDADDGGVARG